MGFITGGGDGKQIDMQSMQKENSLFGVIK